jgi:lipopolysaccharide/colanic/teichoic acid biosynthesis glycosyltransferase
VARETLAGRYAQLAAERVEKRRVDLVLRALDVCISAGALVVFAPAAAAIAIAIRLTSGPPILYRGARVGRAGRVFTMVKFRTLVPDAESRLGPYWGAELDRRTGGEVTRLGRWLRATQLDEVPQLWNVLRGEMSLVGPRPEDAGFVALHTDAYEEILTVRPGVTGLCQLAFAKESAILDPSDRHGHYVADILPQKVRLDTLYARTRSFRGDLRILVWTVLPVLLRVDVAVNRKTGDLTVRRRPRTSPSRAA